MSFFYTYWILLPFLLHNVAMAWDEFHFHHQRHLPTWERLGHPADTVTYLFCLAFILLDSGPQHSGFYWTAAIFSIIFVFKDMHIHARFCNQGEKQLHGVLYSLHVMQLVLAGLVQYANIFSLAQKNILYAFLQTQIILGSLFLLYQIGYWNFWKTRVRKNQQ